MAARFSNRNKNAGTDIYVSQLFKYDLTYCLLRTHFLLAKELQLYYLWLI
jgi:hypothetical protein